jgi:SRSO17 transposase
MVSEIKHKYLPAIAKAVGLDNSQSLHHFLSEISLKCKSIVPEAIGANAQGLATDFTD